MPRRLQTRTFDSETHGDSPGRRPATVPPRRINEIVHGTRAISADSALRLARYFGTSDRFWLNLQTR